MGYVMECKNVTYTYPLADEPSIRNVSLSIEEGKFYGVVGENGSGKSYVIVTFLGILEMMKTGKFTIEQDKLFDDIIITYNPDKEQEEEQ